MTTSTVYLQSKHKGVLIALTIMSTWLCVLLLGVFDAQPFATTFWGDCAWILLTTWLYTGLFITAHEAMHNLILPKSLPVNQIFGRVALFLYAGLSYNSLLRGHIDHHAHPSTEKDPDYWPFHQLSFFRWYLRFLYEYFSWTQLVIMATIYNIGAHVIHIEESQLLSMWVLPPKRAMRAMTRRRARWMAA